MNQCIAAQVVFHRLAEVLDATAEDPQAQKKPWVSLDPACVISCDRLGFHHPGRLELLEDFSLVFPGGLCTALIGESGCGKSTLAKLIAGLYAPQTGMIRYGRFAQRDIPLDAVRQQVSLVVQDPQFFSRSILDNFQFVQPRPVLMRWWRPVSWLSPMRSSASYRMDTKPYSAIWRQPFGWTTPAIGDCSGFVSQGALLILDEATAALDPVLERRLMDQLLQLEQDKPLCSSPSAQRYFGLIGWCFLNVVRCAIRVRPIRPPRRPSTSPPIACLPMVIRRRNQQVVPKQDQALAAREGDQGQLQADPEEFLPSPLPWVRRAAWLLVVGFASTVDSWRYGPTAWWCGGADR